MRSASNSYEGETTGAEIWRLLESLSARLDESKAFSHSTVTPDTLQRLASPRALIDVARTLEYGISKAEYDLAQAYAAGDRVVQLVNSSCPPSELKEALTRFEESVQVATRALDDLTQPLYRIEHMINVAVTQILEIELHLSLPERLVIHALSDGYTLGQIGHALGKRKEWVLAKWFTAREKLEV